MSEKYIMALTTTSSEEEAQEISERLVKQGLAACAQVYGPIRSTYLWEGKINKDEEWMCFMKTKEDVYDSLESKIKEIHSYETPEIIAIPILAGNQDYLDWIDENINMRS